MCILLKCGYTVIKLRNAKRTLPAYVNLLDYIKFSYFTLWNGQIAWGFLKDESNIKFL